MPQKQKDVEKSLHLFRVLFRAYQSVSEHSIRDSKSHGLNPTEFSVLELLFHKGPQPLQKIGSRLLMVSGGVTYTVDKLEKGSLIYRQPCTKDRRVIYAHLSENGKELMEEIFPIHAAAIHEAMTGLTDKEKDAMINLLKKMGIEAEKKL